MRKINANHTQRILTNSMYRKLMDVPLIVYTNKFHAAVRMFSKRSQMTSKCGKNKNVAHEAIAECVTDILTTF